MPTLSLINENNSLLVISLSELISEYPDDNIYIKNSFERPSLNWYSKKQIKSLDNISKSKCITIKQTNDWDLYSCNLDKSK